MIALEEKIHALSNELLREKEEKMTFRERIGELI